MELFIPLFALGALIGGLTALAIGKWPAKSLLGSCIKGASIATGILFIFIIFLFFIFFSQLNSDNSGAGS